MNLHSRLKDHVAAVRHRPERLQGYLYIAPAILVFFGVSLFPILFGIYLSFHAGYGISGLEFVGSSNYQLLASDQTFWNSMERGVLYAMYSVLTQVVVGVAIALFLNQSFKFSNVVRSIVLLPYLIPTVAIAMIFRWLFHNRLGLVNYLLLESGLVADPVNFFSVGHALHSVVWIGNWKFSIFVVLIVLARLQSIDPEMYELAKINGANPLRRFLDVTYPNIKGVLFLVVLLRSIWQFNKFDMIWLLTSGGPFNETLTMVVYAYQIAFQQFRGGLGASLTVVMFLMLLATGIVYFTQFKPYEEVET
ncbi:carbohydrate ABC transporter permease [Halorarum halobium]|uniref:carbohydrate ABC transporter permease n=1 Tax=Halorarum halobium TaxID=3075121 RepID=UPI0028A6F9BA|nr:sugar ABC transporter permease [Halobaculum sp. XH14]